MGAQNILEGKGFTNNEGNLINHWPPLFSLLLALVSAAIQKDLVFSGMILNAIMVFAISLIFYKILKLLKISKWVSIFGVFILLFSAPMKVFLWFLSEGLFSVLLLSSLYLILKWEKTRDPLVLSLAGILNGLFMLTRHAGMSFFIAFSLSIFILSRGDLLKRSYNSLRFVIPSILIFFPWFLYAKSGNSNNTSHFITGFLNLKKIEMSFNVLKHWFIGNYISAKLAPFILAICLAQIIWTYKHIKNYFSGFFVKNKAFLKISLISIAVYYFFLLFANFYYNDQVPLDNRILFPVYPFLIIIISLALQFGINAKLKISSITLIIFLIISSTISAFPVYKDFYKNGLGYTKRKWKESPTINYISNTENKIYYSNAPEILKLHTNKTGKVFPNSSRKKELRTIKRKIENNSAQILILKSFPWREYLVKEEEIIEEFQNFTFDYFEDGIVIKGPSRDIPNN